MTAMAQDANEVTCAHCGEQVDTDALNDYGHCPDCAKLECPECHGVEGCDRDCQCEDCEQGRLENTCIAFDDTYND